MANKLTRMAREILSIEDDLTLRVMSDPQTNNYSVDDFCLHVFEQAWGSTALGFGGIGGQAITAANTYVFVPNFDGLCYVYFAGRFAYSAEYSEEFREDMCECDMAPVYKAGKYKNKNN